MTDPSKMTDDELRLAIAEKMGLSVDEGDWYCPRCDVLISSEQVTYNEKHDKGSCLCPVEWRTIPNYPGDIAAAMGLLDKFKWEVSIQRDVVGNWGCIIYPKPNDKNKIIGVGDTPARAICEAWLKAKGK